jgi:hypothetical protein
MVKYYFEFVNILGESGFGCGAGYIERKELPDFSEEGINKSGLINRLKEGVKNAKNKPNNHDVCYMDFQDDGIVCKREWCYDDGDMNDDYGWSLAKVSCSDIEKMIDKLFKEGHSTGVVDSVNSFYSESRYSEGGHEKIEDSNYKGKVEIKLMIDGDKVSYSFLPSIQSKPHVRLAKGRDYLE